MRHTLNTRRIGLYSYIIGSSAAAVPAVLECSTVPIIYIIGIVTYIVSVASLEHYMLWFWVVRETPSPVWWVH